MITGKEDADWVREWEDDAAVDSACVQRVQACVHAARAELASRTRRRKMATLRELPFSVPFDKRVALLRKWIAADKAARGEVMSEIVVRRSQVVQDGFREVERLGTTQPRGRSGPGEASDGRAGARFRGKLKVTFMDDDNQPERGTAAPGGASRAADRERALARTQASIWAVRSRSFWRRWCARCSSPSMGCSCGLSRASTTRTARRWCQVCHRAGTERSRAAARRFLHHYGIHRAHRWQGHLRRCVRQSVSLSHTDHAPTSSGILVDVPFASFFVNKILGQPSYRVSSACRLRKSVQLARWCAQSCSWRPWTASSTRTS